MQGRPVLVVVLVAVMGLACLAAARSQPPNGERLVWQDEFDRDGLPDPARWSYDVGGLSRGRGGLAPRSHRRARGWS